MSMSSWLLSLGALLLVAASLALPVRSVRPRPSQRRVTWLKGLAALRVILGTTLALVACSAARDAAAHTPDAVRWALTLAAGAAVLVLIINAAAGLWLLSPFVGADLGLQVMAARTRGTIRGYGWARLEVMTPAGWMAHVPYASVLLRPLVVCSDEGPRMAEVTLRRERWGDDGLRYLRQLAVLCPFRDASLPISVTQRGRAATVRLGLAQRATLERVQRHFELALARQGASAAYSRGGSSLDRFPSSERLNT